jgi:hypothetical protein
MRMKKTLLIFSSAIVALGLLSFAKSVTGIIDLTSKGIPVSVNVPDGAVVDEGIGNGLEMDDMVYHVWEVNKGDFSLEVSMDEDEMHQDAEDYINDTKELIEDEDFEAYVLEETNGFIYKYSLDGDVYYSMYYLLVKNGHAIEFSTGMESDDSSLENVRAIYAAAKSAK